MNMQFERSASATDEWYTPKEIIDALGVFDTDPCAPVNPLWQTAIRMYNKNHDGLTKNRIRFFRPDGTRGNSPGCGSILIAFGEENAEVLRTCDIAGIYVRIN